ncbi:hypothetical protein SDC9_128037 [bioreactor metagenome]|uniref:Carrier domain-containing protein n=1 Tax=bioreactor metagenome TaxID=1076179 RepID=A0A645CV25_9ZZZZ
MTQDPEIVAFQARYGESLTRDLRHFENPYSGLYLIGWLSAILCVAALFLPWTSALGVALTASVLCACNLLFYLPIRRRIRKVMGTMIQLAETRKQELFRRLNRPPLDLYDTQSRDHFSRYYEDVYQFRLAMELVCAAGVKHMIYPEDSFLIVCGTHYDSVLKNLHLQDSAKLRQDNVGEVLQEKLRVSKTSLYLPFPCELTNAPPWPEALYKLAERRLDGEWPPFPNREARRIFAARPQLSAELFASYWATRREATVALAIRDLTDEHMDRPDNFMSYPNDPLALLVLWDCDSLETEELLMAMEEHFNIVIPDGEATQLFCHMSLAEAVKYIIWKQDSAICNREATPALPGA